MRAATADCGLRLRTLWTLLLALHASRRCKAAVRSPQPFLVSHSLLCLTGEVLGRDVLANLQRTHVRDEAPDVGVGDSAAPGRHPIRASLIDGLEDFGRCASKTPASVSEARAHRPRSVHAVTVDAVIRMVEL